MVVQMLKGKIHRVRATDAHLDYDGSLAVDALLLEAAGILPNERIEVYSVTTGNRFTTYAIQAAAGSGVVSVNGAAAMLAAPGDVLIICAYAGMTHEQALRHEPRVVLVDDRNRQA